jgi:ferredoxin-NADP reductase
MTLTLAKKIQEAPDVTTFVFDPDEPLTWQAGQFLHYTIPQEHADDRGLERWFTISSAPFERQIHITTRHAEKGSSFKEALFSLPIGATIEADGLEGDFVVDDPSADFVFIAGGIGITPFRSMLAQLDHEGIDIHATLLYANRDDNFVFKAELDAIAAKHPNVTIHYFSADERIDAKAITSRVPNLQIPTFYASGPEPMVETYEKMLADMGVPDSHLKRDFFPGYEAF